MITIDVKVFGGIAPLPIRVYIDNIKTSDDIRFSSNESFKEDFNLVKGEYYVIVSGSNPSDGKTTITITGKDAVNNNIVLNKVKTTELYSAIFYIKV